MDSRLSGPSVHGVLKARILKWFAIPVELFQILKDDALKVLYSICQQFGKLSTGHRPGKGQFSFQFQRKVKSLSHVWLFVTPWTLAHQASSSMGFSRQVYWSGLPFPTPGDFPNPQIKPLSLLSSSLAGRFFTTVPSGKPHKRVWTKVNEGLVEGAIFHELVQQSTQAHSTT